MWTFVGQTIDSAKLRQLMGNIGRTRLHTLRKQGVIPPPDGPSSSPSHPQWYTSTIVDVLPEERRKWLIFEGFNSPPSEGQRWRFAEEYGELLEIELAEDVPAVLAWRWRYEHVGIWHDVSAHHPAGEASLLVPLNGDHWSKLAPGRSLSRAVYEACGYGGNAAGTIIILDTSTDIGLMTAEIPANLAAPVVLESVPSEVIARLLGHKLPVWPEGCATTELVAAWNPATQQPVPVAEPPSKSVEFALARRVRRLVKTLRAKNARDDLIKSFEDMDTDIRRVALGSFIGFGRSKPHLAPAIQVAQEARDYHGVGFIPALEWLSTSEDAPEELARQATGYFGYVDSMGIAEVVAPEQVTVDNAKSFGLSPVQEDSSWCWKALREASGENRGSAYRWDIAEGAFPAMVLVTDTHWYFHVPREPIVDLDDLDHMLISINPAYGLGRLFNDTYCPLAIRPGSSTRSVAECLTAWARTGHYRVGLGQYSPLGEPSSQLIQMLSAQKDRQAVEHSVPNLIALARTNLSTFQ